MPERAVEPMNRSRPLAGWPPRGADGLKSAAGERLGTVRDENASGDCELPLQAIDHAVRDESWP